MSGKARISIPAPDVDAGDMHTTLESFQDSAPTYATAAATPADARVSARREPRSEPM